MGNCACEKEGTYNYPNGDYFKGTLKNDVPSGKGILYYKNGDIKYDGEFVKGKKQGLGKYYLVTITGMFGKMERNFIF